MSLVNRMLQDLDRRHASGAERAQLPRQLRPLPPAYQAARWPWVGAGLFALLVLVTAWSLQGRPGGDATPAPQLIPSSAPPRASGAQQASAASARALRTQVEFLPPTAIVPESAASSALPQTVVTSPEARTTPRISASAQGGGLRVARSLADLPGLSPRGPAPRPSAPAQIVAAVTAKAETVGAAPLPAAQGAPARIEKHERASNPREAAAAAYRRALVQLNQGRLAEAQQGFEAALAEDAGYAPARESLAATLVQNGRGNEARVLLLEGLSQNAAQPRLALPLARLAVAGGDIATALVALSAAAPAAADDAQFRGLYAAVLARSGRHREAVAEYQAALRLAPGAGVWWMGLALSLEAEGRATDAREAYRQAQASGTLTAEVARFVEQRLR